MVWPPITQILPANSNAVCSTRRPHGAADVSSRQERPSAELQTSGSYWPLTASPPRIQMRSRCTTTPAEWRFDQGALPANSQSRPSDEDQISLLDRSG